MTVQPARRTLELIDAAGRYQAKSVVPVVCNGPAEVGHAGRKVFPVVPVLQELMVDPAVVARAVLVDAMALAVAMLRAAVVDTYEVIFAINVRVL